MWSTGLVCAHQARAISHLQPRVGIERLSAPKATSAGAGFEACKALSPVIYYYERRRDTFLIVGGFYSEVALRNEKQRAQCILNTS